MRALIQRRQFLTILIAALCCTTVALYVTSNVTVNAQTIVPTVADSNLGVRTVVAGFEVPTTMAFLGPDDFLIVVLANSDLFDNVRLVSRFIDCRSGPY